MALTRWTFTGNVMSLLSRWIIAFLPRSKFFFLISWLQSPSAVILEPKKMKFLTLSLVSPSVYHELMGPAAVIFVYWMLSFKPGFSLFSFTFIQRFFNSSLLSAIRVVSSAYLRLLIFLLAILIPACASSSPTFHTMYSACKLNRQGDNILCWHTSFPILNQSIVSCLVLFLFFKFLMDNCFTEFCSFLSNLNKNQPQGYIYSLPFETPSHLPTHPTPLGFWPA